MFTAMDSACKARLRWTGVVVGLCSWAGESGCARLQEYRHHDVPMLGTVGKENKYPKIAEAHSRPSAKDDGESAEGSLAIQEDEETSSEPASRPKRTVSRASGTSAGAVEGQGPLEDGPVRVALQPPRPITRGPQTVPSPDPQPPSGSASSPAPPPIRTARQKGPAQAAAPKPTMESIVASARKRLESMPSYQVELTRQERVGESLQPAEDVLLSIRKQPHAVRIEWPGGPQKGREVIYLADKDGGMMHINMADSALPMPRISMRPDSPMALSRSRHPITEAGFETIVAGLETTQRLQKAGDPDAGQLTYGGLTTPPELDRPCHALKQVKPSGETCVVYLDSKSHLPALVQTSAANGDLLEKYLFRNVQANVPELTAEKAFDPDARWGAAPGLFSRLAKVGAADSKSTDPGPR